MKRLGLILLLPLLSMFTACSCGGDVTVDELAPAITSSPQLTALEGQDYAYVVVATGSPVPTVAAAGPEGEALSSWLSFDAESRTLSGVPGPADEGTHDVEIVADNGVEPNAVQTFTITVIATSTAPTITSSPITEAVEGQPYVYTVVAIGNPAPVLLAGGDLPSWLAFDEGSGRLEGTPGSADLGEHPVEVTAANGVEPDAIQSFVITVRPLPQAPLFTSTPVTEVVAGEPYAYTATASGQPEPSFSASSGDGSQLPAWLSFDSTFATFDGVPGEEDVGSVSILLTAANGVLPHAVQTFTIQVLPAPAAPEFTSSPPLTIVSGQTYSYVATATGRPEPELAGGTDDDPLPAWLSFDAETDTLSGIPGDDAVGAHAVVLTAVNDVAETRQEFTITVSRAPMAPVITSTPVTGAIVGSLYSYDVIAIGHPEPTFTASMGSDPLPAWLSFDSTTGVLLGTPGPGDLGTIGIVVTAANGVSPVAVQSYALTVGPAPAAPSITSSPVTTATAAAPYGYTVTATGYPEPTLSATGPGGALPAWLSFAPATGLLSGTPAQAHVGEHEVLIRAENGVSPDAEQLFTVTVLPQPRAPVITSVPTTEAVEGQLYSYIVVAEGEPEPQTGASLASGDPLPQWLSFDAATSRLFGTPDAAAIGSLAILVSAQNGVLPNATQEFTLNVAAAIAAPQIVSAPSLTARVGDVWSYDVVANGNPVPTLAVSGLPPWMSFDGSATIFGTPDPFVLGYDPTITVTATNGIDPAAEQTFTVQVVPAQAVPISGSPLVETFSGGLPSGWAAAGEWEFGIPTVGPPELFDGPLAGTVLGGNYSATTRSSLLTPVLDLTGVQVPILHFAHWHDIEADRFDGANVKISTDGGRSFQELQAGTISPDYTGMIRTGYSNPMAGEQGWSGTTADWLPVTIDLDTNLSGKPLGQVVVRFDLGSDNAVHRPGWYLDSVFLGEQEEWSGPPARLAVYLFDGDVKTPSLTAPNLTAGTLDNRDANAVFVTGNGGGRAILSTAWDDPANPNYFQFALNADPGRQVAFSHLGFDERSSQFGPDEFEIQLIHDGATIPVPSGTGTTLKEDFPQPSPMVTIPFTGAAVGPFEGTVIVRIVARGATASTGTWRLDNVSIAGWVSFVDPVSPTITSPQPPTTASIDVAYGHTITATGNPPPVISVSGLPAWLDFDGVDTLFGTPSALDVGESGPITITASNDVSPNATQNFTISIAPPPSVPVGLGSPFVEGFSASIPAGWSADGDWEFGVPTHGAAPFDGEAAATKLASDYTVSTRSILQTPPLDLSGVDDPLLRFEHWYHIEANAYDGGNVKISTDGGRTFRVLAAGSVDPDYTGNLRTTNPLGGQAAWYDAIPGNTWTSVVVDLETNLGAYPRTQVVIRFDFASDNAIQRPGWHLDDVSIGAAVDLPGVPEITSLPRLSIRVGDIYVYTVEADGLPAPTLAASGAGGGPLPAWLSFDSGTGELVGVPGVADLGSHSVEVTASNVGGEHLQAFDIAVIPADAQPVFQDDFEGDVGASPWIIGFESGTAGDWQIGVPTYGPTAAFFGSRCAGTIIGGPYTSSEARLSFMQTPSLDLTGETAPFLQFHHWHDSAMGTSAGWDGGNVKISTDGGLSFAPLLAGTETPAYTGIISLSYGNPLAGQPAWFGQSSGWKRVEIDLGANLDGLPLDQVVVRFEFGSEAYTKTRPGWYLDEVFIGDQATFP